MAFDFKRPFQVGDTGTAIRVRVYGEDGALRADIATATIRMVNTDLDDLDAGFVVIDAEACDQNTDGILEYKPSAGEITNTADFKFIVSFTATLDGGEVIKSPDYRGVMKVNR